MASSADIIAIVALVISVTSFIVAVLQAVQQYVTSAEGYRKCAKSVMGQWARRTRRTFRWEEVRFEVTYQTPVIFVAPPNNTRGPVSGEPIYNVDGSTESYTNTLTKEVGDYDTTENRAVHTADDERATWLTLLMQLQLSELTSRQWDEQKLKAAKRTEQVSPQRSIVVQIQKRKRSWDFMPDTVGKPYATTTISHLVELALMLGMRWLALDLESWNLRAEGNGFILTSSQVQGLGVMVTFSVTGKNEFKKNHVIPSIDIKALAFGSVATIYHNPKDGQDFELNFGQELDIRRTLLRLNCNQKAMENYFKRRDHVRSVSFELIAMIGRVVRLRGSSFSLIPNPTRDLWNKTFSARELMEEYIANIRKLASESGYSDTIRAILKSWDDDISPEWKDSEPYPKTESYPDIDMRETIHNCLDEHTIPLLQNENRSIVISVVGAHMQIVLEHLNDSNSALSSRDCQTEKDVFAHYFTKVLPSVAEPQAAQTPTSAAFAEAKPALRADIWLTLQFRMCCWWLLHDFSEEDTMILPSRLKGSRLPVFIV